MFQLRRLDVWPTGDLGGAERVRAGVRDADADSETTRGARRPVSALSFGRGVVLLTRRRADLEFVLAARDQFPVRLLRAAYQGLARAYQVLGRQQQAAEARRRSGLGPAAAGRPPVFTGFSVTARDGMRVSAPSALSPAPDVHVAQSYDLGDFAFIQTSAGLVAIDAGTSPDRVRAAMADLGLEDQAPVRRLAMASHRWPAARAAAVSRARSASGTWYQGPE